MPDELCAALPDDLLDAMDGLLQEELRLSTVTEAKDLPQFAPNLILWQGDMSHLHADALVNPANGDLLGCFLPTHKCLDNILHAQAGPRLRIACADMKRKEGLDQDANGKCRVTAAFALPAKYVFHTVGPCLVEHNRRGDPLPPRTPTATDVKELKSCYVECLNAAASLGAESLAFCCISTGVFGYPGEDAARLALKTVKEWMDSTAGPKPLVIFNVFLDKDLITYQRAIQEMWPKVE
jgi:O-acetyl-ADP-ribose deacetylase (regulator of RNase III)